MMHMQTVKLSRWQGKSASCIVRMNEQYRCCSSLILSETRSLTVHALFSFLQHSTYILKTENTKNI